MVKTFKNLLLQNQKSYDLETWHVALGTKALQSFLWQGQIGSPICLNGENCYIKSFNGGKLAAKDYID